MPIPTRPNFDALFKAAFITGACIVCFIAGAVTQHYRLPPASFLSNAFMAADAWYETLKDAPKRKQHAEQAAADLQPARGKLRANEKTAYQGYTVLSYRASTTVHLVDMDGRTVHQWSVPFHKAWKKPPHVHARANARVSIDTAHVFPNGDLLIQYSGLGDTPYGYGIAKVDKDSNILWTYADNAHHDFYVDETDGTIYAITQKILTQPPPGLEQLTYPLLTDDIVILSPDGKEQERIPLLEAFRDSPFKSMLFHKSTFKKNKNWDALHTNSIRKVTAAMAPKFPLFKEGQLLVSVRNMNKVAVIDPDTRKVVWAHGGGWKWQHAAQLLPNGHIMVLDNLGYRVDRRNYIQVIEFDPQTGKTAWEFKGSPDLPLESNKYGRLQRLPNGNTLIAVSKAGRALEVTPAHGIAWDYTALNPGGRKRTLVNATRYAEKDLPFLRDMVKE